MTTRAVAEMDDWDTVPFGGGYAGLRDLADAGFSGIVQAGPAKLCLLKGTPVGVLDGTIEDFEDAAGTAYEAPSPALPLLALMQARGDEVRAEYYTEDTPISEVDRTLSEGGFSGYIELSENVLSGDYYVVYHAGRSMAVAWVGNVGELLTDDEAFRRADDEVGIYQVRQVDVDPVEIPGSTGGSDASGASAGAGAASPGATGAGTRAGNDASASSDDATGATEGTGTTEPTGQSETAGGTGATGAADHTDPPRTTDRTDGTEATERTDPGGSSGAEAATTASPSEAESRSKEVEATEAGESEATETDAGPTAGTDAERSGTAGVESAASTESAETGDAERVRERESVDQRRSEDADEESGEEGEGDTGSETVTTDDEAGGGAASTERLETRSIPSLDPARTSDDRETDAVAAGSGAAAGAGGAAGTAASSSSQSRDTDEDQSRPAPEPESEGDAEQQTSVTADSSTDPRPEATDASTAVESAATDASADAESGVVDASADTPAETAADADGEAPGSTVESDSAGDAASDGVASEATPASRESTQSSTSTSSPAETDAAATGTSSSGPSAASERVANLAAEIEERETEIERLESELASVRGERDELREARNALQTERDRLATERDELAAEVDRLEAETDRLRSELDELRAASGGPAGADRRLSADEALAGTNLFVRYDSKGKATLESAHEGNANREDVAENLDLEHHTQFETGEVSVGGQPFEAFLRESLQYRFVAWVVEDLVYEIRDTGKVAALQDLYDAIPQIDRAELDGTVTVEFTEDGQEKEAEESFDVVLRDRMGAPLVVADLSDSREAATESMMSSLVTASSRVSESHPSLAAAVFVTSSFFEPEALETADASTGHGRFSRDKRTSFVKLSRNQGYHLCLAEARDSKFHLTVPDL